MNSYQVRKARADRLNSIRHEAPEYVELFRHVYDGNAEPCLMIEAMCLECQAYDAAKIAECDAPACPMFPYRGKGVA